MRFKGKVTSWNDERGFGFIVPDDGAPHVFVHINSFTNRRRRPLGDERITYEVTVDGQGRSQAKSVTFEGETLNPNARLGRGSGSPYFAASFLFFLCAAVLSGWLPVAVLLIYVAASVFTFRAYAFDKAAAVNRQWRTPESTLHLLSLCGGWPGAMAAQQFLRHKCIKLCFQIVFWITVMFNCTALAWLTFSSGAQPLRSFLSALQK
jgi:uncharacterized membrane protein YsdA (DUF1294 family)/cold shock CspA family protein